MKIMRKGQWEKQPTSSSRFSLNPSKIYDKTFGSKKKETMGEGNTEQFKRGGVNGEGTTDEALKEKTVSKNETDMEKGEITGREKQNEEKRVKENGNVGKDGSVSESESESGSESDSESEEESDDDEEGNDNNSNNKKEKNVKAEDKTKEEKPSPKNISWDRSPENVEIHKIYENDEEVSRKNSASSEQNAEKKKKGKILNKLKFQSYFHKSYDKFSNALMKTSKSILKTNYTNDTKSDKRESMQSNEAIDTLSNAEKGKEGDTEEYQYFDFTEEELTNVKAYFNNKINIEDSNEEIIKKFKTCLEENDSKKKVLNELTELLNERKLLIKSLNYFKNLSNDYKACAEKYEDSYNVLRSENEQLNENTKILKRYIYNIRSNENNDVQKSTEEKVAVKELAAEQSEEVKG